MTSAWYRRLVPTRLAPEKQSVREFLNTQNGFRLATSIGGVLTGRGADFIIIDDPLNPDEALSETQRIAANDWFDHTFSSRLNDKQNGRIMQRMQPSMAVDSVTSATADQVKSLTVRHNAGPPESFSSDPEPERPQKGGQW